jgi:hypothetical protein
MKITRKAMGRDNGRRSYLEGDLIGRLSNSQNGVTASISGKTEAGTSSNFEIEISTEEMLAMVEAKLSASANTIESRALGRSSLETLRVLLSHSG